MSSIKINVHFTSQAGTTLTDGKLADGLHFNQIRHTCIFGRPLSRHRLHSLRWLACTNLKDYKIHFNILYIFQDGVIRCLQ